MPAGKADLPAVCLAGFGNAVTDMLYLLNINQRQILLKAGSRTTEMEDKMKRLFAAVMLILGIIIIAGCSQRKVIQPPEQLKTEIESPTVKGPKTIAPKDEGKNAREVPKESLTERQLQKAQSDETGPSVELQTRLKDIHFDFDKYDITADDRPVLKELAALLTKNQTAKVVIEGHCDERGTREYNLGLGDRRANSVKEHLVSLGIPSVRLETISYGQEKPLCAESTEECWAKNRRAHFVLVKETR